MRWSGTSNKRTTASFEAFQQFGTIGVDGVVGERTWTVLLPNGDDLERAVGLEFAG